MADISNVDVPTISQLFERLEGLSCLRSLVTNLKYHC